MFSGEYRLRVLTIRSVYPGGYWKAHTARFEWRRLWALYTRNYTFCTEDEFTEQIEECKRHLYPFIETHRLDTRLVTITEYWDRGFV